MCGSFYPPHSGHIQISEEAIKKLNLKEVWWIVAQKHPEKDFINEKNFFKRVNDAKKISKNCKIKIVEDLDYCSDKYTYNNLIELVKSSEEKSFVLLMGADNLLNFHNWYKWQKIFELLPIAIFDRPKHKNNSLYWDIGKFKTLNILKEQLYKENRQKKASKKIPLKFPLFHDGSFMIACLHTS